MVDVSVAGLPDATISKSGAEYTIEVTGLTGLQDKPRDLTVEERAFGVVAANPPTVTTTRNNLELALVRAVEVSMPEGLLDEVESNTGEPVYLKHQLLIAQVTRLVRVCLETLEPST
jgi:hypothetical protein